MKNDINQLSPAIHGQTTYRRFYAQISPYFMNRIRHVRDPCFVMFKNRSSTNNHCEKPLDTRLAPQDYIVANALHKFAQ